MGIWGYDLLADEPDIRRPLKQRVLLSKSVHSAARRQRGGRMGVGERVGYDEGGHRSAARSSSTGRPQRRTAPARGEGGCGWACDCCGAMTRRSLRRCVAEQA